MRGNPEWFPLIARSLSDRAALPPVCGWDLIKNLKPGYVRRPEDKVATGQSPVALATLEDLEPLQDQGSLGGVLVVGQKPVSVQAGQHVHLLEHVQ